MRLFHVSEDPDIRIFEPRPPPSLDSGVAGNAVWALDEYHLPHYLLPRDCPRIALRATKETTIDDRMRLFGSTDISRLIAVETVWRKRIEEVRLFVYEFAATGFTLCDENAGYYISRQAVCPLSKQNIKDPISVISNHGVELRFLENLWPLRNEAIASTASYSIIRMRNALPELLE